jgi:hypothetical protein
MRLRSGILGSGKLWGAHTAPQNPKSMPVNPKKKLTVTLIGIRAQNRDLRAEALSRWGGFGLLTGAHRRAHRGAHRGAEREAPDSSQGLTGGLRTPHRGSQGGLWTPHRGPQGSSQGELRTRHRGSQGGSGPLTGLTGGALAGANGPPRKNPGAPRPNGPPGERPFGARSRARVPLAPCPYWWDDAGLAQARVLTRRADPRARGCAQGSDIIII